MEPPGAYLENLVLEWDGHLIPVEVNATGRPRFRDTSRLRAFRHACGDRVLGALLLHGGDEVGRPSEVSWRLPGGG